MRRNKRRQSNYCARHSPLMVRTLVTYITALVGIILILALSPDDAQAQGTNSNLPGRGSTTAIRFPNDNSGNNSSGLLPNQMLERDTVDEKRKPRKPLESFYFDDSTRQRRIFSWGTSMYNNDITMYEVDTSLANFNIDYPFMRQGVGSASLGFLGGATIPLNYFERPQWQNFSFVQAWSPFIMTPEKVRFYNARTPYTNISYQMSGQRAKEESLFHALISQNVSPSTSFNLDYTAEGTKGTYLHQRTMDRNFAANFAHTGKRYAIHAGYIYNVGDVSENGGVQNMSDVTDTLIDLPENVPVRLANARNVYRGHTFYLTQSYGIPLRRQRDEELTISKIPSVFVGQSMEYTTFRRIYTDKGDTSYYANHLINPTETLDSIRQSMFDIKLFAQIQPYNRQGALGLITGGIGAQFNDYYHYVPESFQADYGAGGSDKRTSIYVYGQLDGAISRYARWGADAKLYMLGYRSGDLDINGRLTLSAYIKDRAFNLNASVRYSLREPDYWQQNYFSNHYAWSNSFVKENTTLLKASFTVPSWNLELGGSYELATNKIYYGPNVVPLQSSKALNVMGIYLQKDFHIGGFFLNHRVLLQWSSDQMIAPVPLASAYLSYGFGFNVVKNVLYMKLGVDARYNTEYYAYAYNPAIAQFYTQNQVKLGNYPQLDAFVAAKWKRLRFQVKVQHWNQNLIGGNRYFSVVDYPQNRLMLKFGLSWSFYD